MAHSVSKSNAGFEGTGEIKFSQLRTTFLKTSSGSISASQLLRNTDRNLISPIVPDCTENSGVAEYKISNGIITSEDWKVSQMRGLILRYEITQSGSDTDLNATGLAWNNNLIKNIPKIYQINGNIIASLYTKDALTFKTTDVSQSIVNLEVLFGSGTIKGAGGPGGGSWGADNGGPGGDAFKFDSINGKNNIIDIPNRSSIVIAGGGGGGGKGGDGADGPTGVQWKPRISRTSSNYTGSDYAPGPSGEWYSYSISTGNKCDSKSNWDDHCYSDVQASNENASLTFNGTIYNSKVYGGNNGEITSGTYASNADTGRNCDNHCRSRIRIGWTWFRWDCGPHGDVRGPAYCTLQDPEIRPGAPGGYGGDGGNGQGCNQSQSDGEAGTQGTSAENNPNYATEGNQGMSGGDGGDWGENGDAGGTSVFYDDGTSDITYTIIKNFTSDDNNNVTLDMDTGVYTFMVDGQVVTQSTSKEVTINDRRYTAGDNPTDTVSTPNVLGVEFDENGNLVYGGSANTGTVISDDDWLGKFYRDNNIGGPGGVLDATARTYWENQAATKTIEEVKSTIEGTAKLQGTWNLTTTLIRISIGWDDEKGGNDHGVAWERYQIPDLGVDFQVRNAGNNITEWGARTQVVEVEPNRTYTAILTRGSGTTTATWRHNNNQRFCIPDQQGTDANAQIWISSPNKVFPSSSGEITERLNRDRVAYNSLNRTWYYWPSNDGNTENNGSQGLYPDEVDAAGNPTGSKVQIRGMVDPDVMSSNTTSDISGWSDTGVAVETVYADESEIFEVQVESISGLGGGSGGSEGFPGGYAGAAVCGTGYVVEGFINSNSIRGEYRPDFEGPTATYYTTTTTVEDSSGEDVEVTVTYNRAWRTTFEGIEYETVHSMSYIAGQTYLSLAQSVFTYVYQGTTIGTLTLGTGQQEPVVSGVYKSTSGNLVVSSNSWSQPSYYEIEVQKLKTYSYFEGDKLVIVYEGVTQGSTTANTYVENGGKRFYGGNLAIDNGGSQAGATNYYTIRVEEYITITGE